MAEAPNRTWEIRPSGIIGGPPETWPWWKCEPASQPKGRGLVTLHLQVWRAGVLSQPRRTLVNLTRTRHRAGNVCPRGWRVCGKQLGIIRR